MNVVDVLPASTEFVDAEATGANTNVPCSLDASSYTLTCGFDHLDVGATVDIHITVIPQQVGATLKNVAMIIPDDPDMNSSNNSSVSEKLRVVASW